MGRQDFYINERMQNYKKLQKSSQYYLELSPQQTGACGRLRLLSKGNIKAFSCC